MTEREQPTDKAIAAALSEIVVQLRRIADRLEDRISPEALAKMEDLIVPFGKHKGET